MCMTALAPSYIKESFNMKTVHDCYIPNHIMKLWLRTWWLTVHMTGTALNNLYVFFLNMIKDVVVKHILEIVKILVKLS